mmetsp:Transcript_375/g.1098  ORF Transcript_375/g.1098 Transcript_375/m.1098 type:complete len:215 (-) Transcript_375:1072-1716(-)
MCMPPSLQSQPAANFPSPRAATCTPPSPLPQSPAPTAPQWQTPEIRTACTHCQLAIHPCQELLAGTQPSRRTAAAQAVGSARAGAPSAPSAAAAPSSAAPAGESAASQIAAKASLLRHLRGGERCPAAPSRTRSCPPAWRRAAASAACPPAGRPPSPRKSPLSLQSPPLPDRMRSRGATFDVGGRLLQTSRQPAWTVVQTRTAATMHPAAPQLR